MDDQDSPPQALGEGAPDTTGFAEDLAPRFGEDLAPAGRPLEEFLSGESGRPRRTLLHRLSRPEVAIPVLLTLAVLLIHLIRLGDPSGIIPLDEQHYVPDAKDLLAHGVESHFVVHPPLGKWFIALGMLIYGKDSAFGWRVFGALLGSLSILTIYLIARRLWSTGGAAVIAAILLGVDGLWFVQSRVAMLDIYGASFGLLSLWLLLEDRARAGPLHRGFRWWRVASGVAAGLAIASKWSSATFILLAVGAGLAWAISDSRGRERRVRRIAGGGAKLAGTFLLLPAVIYVASFTPWFVDSSHYLPPLCEKKGNVSGWICYQQEVYRFHKNLRMLDDKGKASHPYFSEPWAWPWIGRPVAHYYKATGEGTEQRDAEVLGLPNPIVWWAGFLAVVPLAWWAVRRRDQVAGLILAGFAVNYLPYLVTGFFGRANFLFYATPLVPFLVLGVTHVLHRVSVSRPGADAFVVGYVALAVAAFVYFYPVLAGLPISHEGTFGWRAHMWFTKDCTVQAIKKLCWI